MIDEKRFFEDYYKKGEDSWEIFSDELRSEKFKKRVEIVKDFLHSISIEGNVLDVGCGEGYFDQFFDLDIVGLDLSKAALLRAKAKERISNGLIGNAISLPLKSSSFRLVFLMETLYYHEADKILSEVSRTIKKNGFLILSVGNRLDIGGLLHKIFASGKKNREWGIIYSKSGHRWYENRYSYFDLKKILKKHGFKIRKYEGVLLFLPFLARKSAIIRKRLLFPLGSIFKLFSNQIVLIAEKLE